MLPDWEIWLDMNISPIIAKWMTEHTKMTVKSSYSLSFRETQDIDIYTAAKEYGNVILLSKDADFSDPCIFALRYYLPDQNLFGHPKVPR